MPYPERGSAGKRLVLAGPKLISDSWRVHSSPSPRGSGEKVPEGRVRGLLQRATIAARHFVRRFIVERIGDAPIRVRDLVPDDISRFVLRHARSGSPTMAKMIVTALRLLLPD